MPEANLQIAESAADADEETSTGTVSLTTKTTSVGVANKWWAGHFALDVPRNAWIVSAILEIWITTATEYKELEVKVEAVDNSAAFEVVAKNITGRSWEKATGSAFTGTPAAKAFNAFPLITFNTLGGPAGIGALPFRAGWTRGNTVAVALHGLKAAAFTVENWDGATAHAAKLNLIWLPKPPLTASRAVQRASTW